MPWPPQSWFRLALQTPEGLDELNIDIEKGNGKRVRVFCE
jgi:hypothetical protein